MRSIGELPPLCSRRAQGSENDKQRRQECDGCQGGQREGRKGVRLDGSRSLGLGLAPDRWVASLWINPPTVRKRSKQRISKEVRSWER